jgi:hypothetical protein
MILDPKQRKVSLKRSLVAINFQSVITAAMCAFMSVHVDFGRRDGFW